MHANNKIKQNQRPLDFATQKLAEKLHKPVIKKVKKIIVYFGFKDNIWGVDLAHMQLINKFNRGFRFLLCVIDIFSKYGKIKKVLQLLMLFRKFLKNLKENQTKHGLIK